MDNFQQSGLKTSLKRTCSLLFMIWISKLETCLSASLARASGVVRLDIRGNVVMGSIFPVADDNWSIRERAIATDMEPFSISFRRTAEAAEYVLSTGVKAREKCMMIVRHAFCNARVSSLVRA